MLPCCILAASLAGQPVALWAVLRGRLFGGSSAAAAGAVHSAVGARSVIIGGLLELALIGLSGAGIILANGAEPLVPHLVHICSVFAH